MDSKEKDKSTYLLRYKMHAYKIGLRLSSGNEKLATEYAEALTIARASGMEIFRRAYAEIKPILNSFNIPSTIRFKYYSFNNELVSKVLLRKIASKDEIIDKWTSLGLSFDVLTACVELLERKIPELEEKIAREGPPMGMFPFMGVTVKKEALEPHKETHEDEGTDEIDVAGLSGQLVDLQPPKLHGSEHLPDGGDPISDDLAKESTQLEVLAELLQKLEKEDLATLEGIDFATQTTLAQIKAKTDNLNAQLSTLATQSTLASILTELNQKLEASDLATLEGKDFATQTTLALLLTELEQKLEASDLATLEGKDFATQTTLASLLAKDFATQTTLASILTELNAKLEASELANIITSNLDPYGPYEKDVAAAGTPEQLGAHPCKAILIQAKSENTGIIKIGNSDATCKIEVEKGDAYSCPCTNSNKKWIDVTVNGEGIWYEIVN